MNFHRHQVSLWRLNNWALMATITVLTDISNAPAVGERRILPVPGFQLPGAGQRCCIPPPRPGFLPSCGSWRAQFKYLHTSMGLLFTRMILLILPPHPCCCQLRYLHLPRSVLVRHLRHPPPLPPVFRFCKSLMPVLVLGHNFSIIGIDTQLTGDRIATSWLSPVSMATLFPFDAAG
jgi:hypothetical protein